MVARQRTIGYEDLVQEKSLVFKRRPKAEIRCDVLKFGGGSAFAVGLDPAVFGGTLVDRQDRLLLASLSTNKRTWFGTSEAGDRAFRLLWSFKD